MILPVQTIGLPNVHLMVTVGHCGYAERPNGTPNITTQSLLASFIQFVLNLGHCTVIYQFNDLPSSITSVHMADANQVQVKEMSFYQ